MSSEKVGTATLSCVVVISQVLSIANSRSLSRRVLNEDALVNAVSKFVKIQAVHFDALSYAEQVST